MFATIASMLCGTTFSILGKECICGYRVFYYFGFVDLWHSVCHLANKVSPVFEYCIYLFLFFFFFSFNAYGEVDGEVKKRSGYCCVAVYQNRFAGTLFLSRKDW